MVRTLHVQCTEVATRPASSREPHRRAVVMKCFEPNFLYKYVLKLVFNEEMNDVGLTSDISKRANGQVPTHTDQ